MTLITLKKFSLTFPGSKGGELFGDFTNISELSMWMEGEQVWEGGDDAPNWRPMRINYKPLIVSRVLSREQSPKTWEWVFDNMKNPVQRTGEIAFFEDGGTKEIIKFQFLEIMPVSWRVPVRQASADTLAEAGAVAFEEIEFAHRGFKVIT
ncbi:phage tail protein [Streptomyces sp. NPDC051555]|uniref:phage tail protein n=1 Tax=Streptomyces sp. NPDC051555 TaxID=3365657 RepID=UPI00379FC487